MLASNIKILCETRGLRHSDLARMAKISRQAVSLWFKKDKSKNHSSIRLDHIYNLSKALGVKIDDLMLPAIDVNELEVTLLWDNLYPTVVELVNAAIKGEDRALARMVQVYGLLSSTKLYGKKVINNFTRFQKYIHPVRREETIRIWQIIKNQN